ncbi:hypothetical protein [Geminisphaera colitermitum]|uniref:hypothetical protein n=1 Tax=Geminisphaera colitermitum TaxID=1148786 RepID=UPI000158C618|nr:hypothetical protein [Geminisphaera colitermitum]
MWLCTKIGFFSIVQKLPGEYHVRARAKRDLENLCRLVATPASAKWQIHRSEPADYRWRLVVGEEAIGAIFAALSTSIDYSNFKSEIAATPGQRDKLGAYSAFHHDLEHWQETSRSA